MRSEFTIRPAHTEDEALQRSIFEATRAHLWAPLPPSLAEEIAKMQFHAQTSGYREQYPGCRTFVIEGEGQPIGTLIMHVTPKSTRLVDLAVAPAHQGMGAGTHAIRWVQRMAGPLPVVLCVERTNRAQVLYERLGFQVREAVDDLHHELIWHPRAEDPPKTEGQPL